jgi:Domain of unknown function (DUF1707)
MAGLEHEMGAGGGRGRLRASDADRERVIGTLKAAYVYGLVTKDEFDARVSQTFVARTRGALAVITADIPADLPAAPPSLRPAPATASAPVAANLTPTDRAVIVTAVIGVLAMVAGLLLPGAVAGPLPLAGLLTLGGVGSVFVSSILFVKQARSQRASRGQLPPQRGAEVGSSTTYRAIAATSAERLPRAGKPRRRSNADAARRHPLRPQLST